MYEEIRSGLKKVLDKGRMRHTVGVADTAACLALRYNYDFDKAYLTGLLHDCAKCVPAEDRIPLCEKYGIELLEVERENTFLIHAKLGAEFARDIYGINDEEILEAIRYHTTGKPDMSLLSKIIYVADYIEPGREHIEAIDRARKLAFDNLDKCICTITKDSISYIKARNLSLCDLTVKTYEFYSNLENGDSV